MRLEMKEHTPLRLDVKIRADVARLPFYLKRLIPDQGFLREVDSVRSPRGTAEGRVIFDSLQKPVQTLVDVPSFSLHAFYKRFPYPIDIEGGSFLYNGAGQQASVKNLYGKAGRSSFSGLSARLALGPDPYLAIDSCAADVSLEEIYPWLQVNGAGQAPF